MRRFLSCTLVAALVAASGAEAAVVTPGNGIVSINRGEGYQRVTQPTEVGPGDQVMVGEGGSAQITYENGVTTAVTPGQVVTVPAVPPAAAAAAAGGLTAGQMIIGGAVVAAAGVGIAAAAGGGGGGSKGSSPSPAASP